jgi:hypothetical protein
LQKFTLPCHFSTLNIADLILKTGVFILAYPYGIPLYRPKGPLLSDHFHCPYSATAVTAVAAVTVFVFFAIYHFAVAVCTRFVRFNIKWRFATV